MSGETASDTSDDQCREKGRKWLQVSILIIFGFESFDITSVPRICLQYFWFRRDNFLLILQGSCHGVSVCIINIFMGEEISQCNNY